MARDPLQRDGKAWANAQRAIAAAADLGLQRPRVGVTLGTFDTRGLRAIPPEIAAVPNLVGVSLHGASFRDVSALIGLPVIEELSIHLGCPLPRDALTGLRPLQSLYLAGDGDLDVFAGQSTLRQLRLEKSARADLTALPALPALETLWLWQLPNLLTMRGIEAAPALCGISLLDTPVADISSLAGLAHLRSLGIDGAMVSDAGPLSGLTHLQSLHLRGAPLADLAPLAGLTALRSLWLSDGTAPSLASLSGLTGLQSLGVAGYPVADLGPLAGMAGLQRLSLRGTLVRDLSPIAHLTGLGTSGGNQGLDLADTPAAEADPLLLRNYAAPDQAAETARIFARVQATFG